MSNIVEFPGAARPNKGGRLLIPSRLRDARKLLRMTQGELGDLTDVSRQAISAFERGEKSPDPRTFSLLANALRQPVAFFTTDDAPKFGETSPSFYRKFGPETLRRNEACGVMGSLLVQLARHFDDFINYPAVDLPDFGEQSLDGVRIDEIAEELRRHWGLGLGPISNVLALLESKGIIACHYELTGEKVEAFSFWNGPRAFIFMASEKEVAVRRRFDLAHELGHLVLHRYVDSSDLEDKASLKKLEREADRFAGAFLLPRGSFPNEVYTPRLDAFIDLKQRWRVSIQAMIYRCSDLGVLDEWQVLNLRKQISFRKWRSKEPLDDPNVLAVEEPRLLARAFDLLNKAGVMDVDRLLSAIPINPALVEELCALSPGALANAPSPDISPTLK